MDNYNYPMGADNSSAPWNQQPSKQDYRDVDAVISMTLSKKVTLAVDDYIATTWEDWDIGDEGERIHTGGIDYDYSECNLNEAYEEQEFTIPMLLDILKKYVEADINGSFHTENERAEVILDACNAWNVDEMEVIQD